MALISLGTARDCAKIPLGLLNAHEDVLTWARICKTSLEEVHSYELETQLSEKVVITSTFKFKTTLGK